MLRTFDIFGDALVKQHLDSGRIENHGRQELEIIGAILRNETATPRHRVQALHQFITGQGRDAVRAPLTEERAPVVALTLGECISSWRSRMMRRCALDAMHHLLRLTELPSQHLWPNDRFRRDGRDWVTAHVAVQHAGPVTVQAYEALDGVMRDYSKQIVMPIGDLVRLL